MQSNTNQSSTEALTLASLLQQHQHSFGKVVLYDTKDQLMLLHFTAGVPGLDETVVNDTELFSQYIDNAIGAAAYGIGGYDELRTVYARSQVFDDKEEPRRLHLGVDIWGPAGTPVFAPLDGTVHSFAFNNHFGDYGATIILQHELGGKIFYTLYGHLALADLDGLHEGKPIDKGNAFAHFGPPAENGHWPPHLHFQVIENLGDWRGDYPGVCKFSEREKYLANSPDADLLLQMMQYAKQAS